MNKYITYMLIGMNTVGAASNRSDFSRLFCVCVLGFYAAAFSYKYFSEREAAAAK